MKTILFNTPVRLRPGWVMLAGLLALLGATPAWAVHTATATATLSYGFVVHITVTDEGKGYSLVPSVSIRGGGGTGATATATVSNDAVTQITIASPGSGYTEVPEVLIDAPVVQPFLLDSTNVVVVTLHGAPGDTNRIERATSLGATTLWAPRATVVLTNSAQEWFDRQPAKARSFYRAALTGTSSGAGTPEPALLGLETVQVVTLRGEAGDTNRIETSMFSAMSGAWTPLETVVLTNPVQEWYDHISPRGAQRFYRAVIPTGGPAIQGFVWIAPGTFLMGSPAGEPSRQADEVPHSVDITRGYYMGKYEVTQAEYESVIGNNPSLFRSSTNLPVENVSWQAATNYCARLTARELAAGRIAPGWSYRLPTEAEWEYACRAGTTTAYSTGDALAKTQANFNPGDGTAVGKTTVVGSYAPNGWGLYDMHGNVWEWCQDWYGAYPSTHVADPAGPATGSARVYRSGNWYFSKDQTRSARRDTYVNPNYNGGFGLRVVLADNPR